jgi:dTDP-4-amino-4,6-dideoxygalactose transaminase
MAMLQTRAIIPVHLYGNVALIERLSEISKKYNIPIVEDSAQSLGSTYKRKHTGTFFEENILELSLRWDVIVCILLK